MTSQNSITGVAGFDWEVWEFIEAAFCLENNLLIGDEFILEAS